MSTGEQRFFVLAAAMAIHRAASTARFVKRAVMCPRSLVHDASCEIARDLKFLSHRLPAFAAIVYMLKAPSSTHSRNKVSCQAVGKRCSSAAQRETSRLAQMSAIKQYAQAASVATKPEKIGAGLLFWYVPQDSIDCRRTGAHLVVQCDECRVRTSHQGWCVLQRDKAVDRNFVAASTVC